MVQLVACSDVNASDRLGGRISPQIGNSSQILCSHQQETKKALFIQIVWRVLGLQQDFTDLSRGKLYRNNPTDRHMSTFRVCFTLEPVG